MDEFESKCACVPGVANTPDGCILEKHVTCDKGCMSMLNPYTIGQLQRSLEHWRFHTR